jgi:rhodanese-related sulfurtransferase
MQAQQLWERREHYRWVDVRTPGEYASEHIEGSENIPLDQIPRRLEELRHSSSPLVVVCRSGARANQACQHLLEQLPSGSFEVLEGGLNAWRAQHLPLKQGRGAISLERQVRILAGSLIALASLLALFVDPRFAIVSGLMGTGLAIAGITDSCAMALLLARLPYNQRCGGSQCS